MGNTLQLNFLGSQSIHDIQTKVWRFHRTVVLWFSRQTGQEHVAAWICTSVSKVRTAPGKSLRIWEMKSTTLALNTLPGSPWMESTFSSSVGMICIGLTAKYLASSSDESRNIALPVPCWQGAGPIHTNYQGVCCYGGWPFSERQTNQKSTTAHLTGDTLSNTKSSSGPV